MPQKKTRKPSAKAVPEKPRASPQPREMPASDMPLPVKIISILYYIGSALFLILGITIISSASIISTIIPFLATIPGALITIVAVLVGILLIAIGVTEFFTARGLWQGKSWARILAIVLSLLGFAGALLSLPNLTVWTALELLIDGAIAGYLLFSPEAKSAFQ